MSDLIKTSADFVGRSPVPVTPATTMMVSGPGNIATGAGTNNRCYWTPLVVPVGTYDQIAVVLMATAGVGTAPVGRLGLYADGGGVPGALLTEYGTVDLSTGVTTIKPITINLSVAVPTLYWGACAIQASATTAPQMACMTSSGVSNTGLLPLIGTYAAMSGNYYSYVQDTVSGALPASYAGGLSSNVIVRTYLRKA